MIFLCQDKRKRRGLGCWPKLDTFKYFFVNGAFDAPVIKEATLIFFGQCMRPTLASKGNLSRCISILLIKIFLIILEVSSSNLWCDFSVLFFISPFLSLLYANFLCFLFSLRSSVFNSVQLWLKQIFLYYYYVYHQFQLPLLVLPFAF